MLFRSGDGDELVPVERVGESRPGVGSGGGDLANSADWDRGYPPGIYQGFVDVVEVADWYIPKGGGKW